MLKFEKRESLGFSVFHTFSACNIEKLGDGASERCVFKKQFYPSINDSCFITMQIRVVNAFRSGLEHGSMGNIAQFHGTPRSYRYGKQHVTGIETAV